jgi:hypothetical protein
MALLTDYIPGSYHPAMMEYDGSTGYYDTGGYTLTTSGNKITVVGRFKRATFTGGVSEYIARCTVSGNTHARFGVYLLPTDFATADNQNKLVAFTTSSTGGVLAVLPSVSNFTDDAVHTFMYSFDGDAGTAQFIVDGQNEINTGASNYSAPTTGTLATASQKVNVGSNQASANLLDGEIGFFGYRDAYLTNWSDFMHGDGSPKVIDASGWSEWGAQPLFWNPHGDMINNLGSAGNMTKNGTIVVGDGGAL